MMNPQDIFVGYDDLRSELLRGLKNGQSYCVVGGHKCGGTAFMKSIHAEISTRDLAPLRAVPCFLDINACVPRSPFDFFREVYQAVTRGQPVASWSAPRDSQPYQEFLARMDDAAPVLEQAYGPNWVAVLVIDSLDAAVPYLKDDECFQNLHNLLASSRYQERFRMVAWGVSGMGGLAVSAGSPLNNLRPKYLRVLKEDECRTLIYRYWPAGFDPALEPLLIELSGRHPYLTYGILRYLKEITDVVGEDEIRIAASRFIRDRLGVFRTWLRDLEEGGCRLYQALLDVPPDGIKVSELKRRVRGIDLWDETLLRLSYHCVIDDSAPDTIHAPGCMFKNWFRENYLEAARSGATATAEPAAEPVRAVPKGKRVFVVYGRNQKIRTAAFGFLRSLELEPIEWHQAVEATGNPAPHISEVLERGFSMANAAVVLLTPDDVARLREEFRRPEDPTYECDLTPQPRPNVLFEAGMAFARFPRSTLLVQVGAMRPFSDIAGIHLLVMDDSYEKRKEFVRRLKMADCDVNDGGTGWHTEGTFSL
jgi:predicted nucleotide-binding protein